MPDITDTIDPTAEALAVIEERIAEQEQHLEWLAAKGRHEGVDGDHARARITELQRRAAILGGQLGLRFDD